MLYWPLLERLRFLCITCTNLDEFFEIRVAALKQRIEIGAPAQGPEKLSAQQIFDSIRHSMLGMVQQQYELLNGVLFPEMKKAGLVFLQDSEWNDEQREWLLTYFLEQVVPVLTPLTFDPSCTAKMHSAAVVIAAWSRHRVHCRASFACPNT